MKKLFTLSMVILITISVLAQPPQKMSYQVVIRNSNNELVTNHAIGMRISILQGSATGTVVYTETQTPTTNANGLVSIEIGGGAGFDAINWSADTYFIKTETDPNGGTSYTITGTSQLLSVPYALYSKTSGNGSLWSQSGSNIYYSSGNVGIGVSDPTYDLDVRGSNLDDDGVVQLGNSDLSHRLILFGGRQSDPNPFISWKQGDPLRFATDEGGWSEKMRITSLGLVGIGTAAPTSELDVIGIITATGGNFTNDLLVNGLTLGKGNSSVSTNTAIGASALHQNTTGNGTVAIGIQALYYNTTGDNNVAIGSQTLFNNTTGNSNTASGGAALYSNTTGNSNTANGYNALNSNTEGHSNTANGNYALRSNTTGYANTANGSSALALNTEGNNNTAIGIYAGYTNSTGNRNVFLGSYAGYYETGSNKLYIDNQVRSNESDARVKSLIYGVFDANPANQVLTINGNVNVNSNKITNVADPTSDKDAANKGYVDNNSVKHTIGEFYGGGIVFYVYDNGQHGLIAATADQSTGVVWTNTAFQSTVSNAVRDGINGGLANTERIIIQAGAGSYAAQLCADYKGGNYSDWYLPSKYELNLLYLQKAVVGGFASSLYWSSTETNFGNAWLQGFTNGGQGYVSKYSTYYVRAIRAF